MIILRNLLVNHLWVNDLQNHNDLVLVQIAIHLLVLLFRLLKLHLYDFLMCLLTRFSFWINIRQRKVDFIRGFGLTFIFFFINRFLIFILIWLTICLCFILIQIISNLLNWLCLLLIRINLLQGLRLLPFRLIFFNRNWFWINLLNLSLLYLLNWSSTFAFHF